MSLIAAFPGTCAECASQIVEGDYITSALDGYVHVECSDKDDDYPARATELCTTCFLETPCFCEGDL